MSWLHETTEELLGDVDQARAAGVFPYFRPLDKVGARSRSRGRDYLNFTSNDYLGLSQDPRLAERATAALSRFGTGLGSSPLQASTAAHTDLESQLAHWLGFQAAAVFPSGYQTLVGVLSAFLQDDITVIADSLSHASIIDGIRLARGNAPDLEERYFRHNRMAALKRVLQSATYDKKLVIVEGLYSADGDLAPLADVVELCQEFDARLLVDDAHGVGALGPTGRGVAEHCGVLDQVDFLVGTFSKSFGSSGGFVCADGVLIDFLRFRANAFAFSAALPTAQVAAARAALEIIKTQPGMREVLQAHQAAFRSQAQEAGFDLGLSETHITPIMIGDEHRALAAGAALEAQGVLMMPFLYPGVPLGQARLRCSLTAAHQVEDLTRALEALEDVARTLPIKRTNATPATGAR